MTDRTVRVIVIGGRGLAHPFRKTGLPHPYRSRFWSDRVGEFPSGWPLNRDE